MTLVLFKQKAKHIGAVLISVIIIFLLSAVLFLSSSLQYSLLSALHKQGDFTVTRIEAGKPANTPAAWVDQVLGINGVTQVAPRIYGRYFLLQEKTLFWWLVSIFLTNRTIRHCKDF